MALTLLLRKARPPSKSTTTWDAYRLSGFRAVRAEDAPKPERESYPRG